MKPKGIEMQQPELHKEVKSRFNSKKKKKKLKLSRQQHPEQKV